MGTRGTQQRVISEAERVRWQEMTRSAFVNIVSKNDERMME
ncbi:MAG: hypothetical protein NTU85_03265 [Candidatus Kaiserbacteria bacterium]|nr:hypothetical protein [Candidatus Kaiserbacteria bacterium]